MRLAVLPFDNLGDTADAYFADGVTDAVRDNLASVSGLQVIASASSGQYRHTTKSPREIGRELGVRYLLVGKVRWSRTPGAPSLVEVRPELVDAVIGADKWGAPFDAPLTDVFQVQADIATKVVHELQIALTPATRQVLNQPPTTSVDAYDAYLRAGATIANVVEEDQARSAVSLSEQAIALDSNFALAYARLGEAEDILYEFYEHTDARLRSAKTAIDHALRLTPNAPDAILALGTYEEARGDLTAALHDYHSAYQLEPSFARAAYFAGDVESETGDYGAAEKDYAAAVSLDPRTWVHHERLGSMYQVQGRYSLARREFDQEAALAADAVEPYDDRIDWLCVARGDTNAAHRVYDSAVAHFGNRRLAQDLGWGLSSQFAPDAVGAVGLSAFAGDTTAYYLFKTRFYRGRGVSARGLAYADSTRGRLERTIRSGRASRDTYYDVARVYDYLGRHRDAIREAEAALAATPDHPLDASEGPYLLAYVKARAGELDAAVDTLRNLLNRPSDLSRACLRVLPNWNFLGADARFAQLLAEPDPGEPRAP